MLDILGIKMYNIYTSLVRQTKGAIMGTFLFWLGVITFYVLTWLSPLLSETRR